MRNAGLALALYGAIGIGFAAGKLDLDVKLRQIMHEQQLRIAAMNGAAVADALERRKLAVPVSEVPPGD